MRHTTTVQNFNSTAFGSRKRSIDPTLNFQNDLVGINTVETPEFKSINQIIKLLEEDSFQNTFVSKEKFA